MLRWFENRIDPYPDAIPQQPKAGLVPFIWSCLHGVRHWILGVTVLTAIIGAFEAYLFSMMGSIIDWLGVIPPEQLWTQKKHQLLVMLAIVAVSPCLVFLHTSMKYQTIQGNFPMRLRWNFHRLMLDQSMSFYQDEFAGRVSAKVMQTAMAVRDTVMILADMLVFICIYFGACAVILGHFDTWILAPFAAWFICFSITVYYFVPRLGRTATAQADARSLMTGRITDAYANIATVKLFSHGQREAAYAKSAMHEFMGTVYRQLRLVSQFETVNHTLNMALVASTVALTLWLWQNGNASIGAIAAATAMALRLNGISHWIMWEMSMLFENIGTVQDGMRTLSRPYCITDQSDAQELNVSAGAISFDSVTFKYDLEHTLFDSLALQIAAGEKIGLVGRSGAGKSTIVNLLLRFYDIDEGAILIDHQNIAHVTQNSLRAQIGMVTQDTSLLHRSVRDNILYGRPNASDEEMIHAAKRAQAHDFIIGLTDNQGRTAYDAHVGERGVKLSGGQRQRIAIARVMLKDAPILLLDEATSALDSEVENAIQTSLYQLMEGKTVIAIAHRLSTIAAMDRLVVLDGGRIIEQGTHPQLIAKNGLYARLWAHQSGGFLGEVSE